MDSETVQVGAPVNGVESTGDGDSATLGDNASSLFRKSKGKTKKAKKGDKMYKKTSTHTNPERVARPSQGVPSIWGAPLAVLPVASSSRESILQAALLASASGRPFEDVNFFVFSRRRLDGSIDRPLPLLANSTLIRKASSHFDYLFAQGFTESGITDMAAPYPSTRSDSTDDYAYASDSDLEDEDETEGAPGGESDIEPDHEAEPKLGTNPGPVHSTSQATPGPSVAPQKHVSAAPGKPGRVVFLEDIAYKTWKAFIFYAYLGEKELSFAPLRSEQKAVPKELGPDKAPPCSPKSMYRLAEKYDIAPLKALAAAEIKKRLSTHNILEEVFSTFTSLYPDIRTMEIEYLRENMKDAGIKGRLPAWIEAMEDGHLPKGAGHIVSLLLSTARYDSSLPEPGMKRCPGGCTSTTYSCTSCGRRF